MPVVIRYDLDDADARAFFDYAGWHTRRLGKPLRSVRDFILGAVEAQFDTEGMAMSGGWAPLTEGYQRRKEEDGYGGRGILVRTGALRDEATSPHSVHVRAPGGGVGELEYAVNRFASDGTDLAEAHARGRFYGFAAQWPYTNMEARPIFEMTPLIENGIENIFNDWLDELRRQNRRARSTMVGRPSVRPSFTWETGGGGWFNMDLDI